MAIEKTPATPPTTLPTPPTSEPSAPSSPPASSPPSEASGGGGMPSTPLSFATQQGGQMLGNAAQSGKAMENKSVDMAGELGNVNAQVASTSAQPKSEGGSANASASTDAATEANLNA